MPEPRKPDAAHKVVEFKLTTDGGIVALDSAGRLWQRVFSTEGEFVWVRIEGPPVNSEESD